MSIYVNLWRDILFRPFMRNVRLAGKLLRWPFPYQLFECALKVLCPRGPDASLGPISFYPGWCTVLLFPHNLYKARWKMEFYRDAWLTAFAFQLKLVKVSLFSHFSLCYAIQRWWVRKWCSFILRSCRNTTYHFAEKRKKDSKHDVEYLWVFQNF